MISSSLFFFFFQAEDGIRDVAVTGVQTCALPILFGGSSASNPLLNFDPVITTIVSIDDRNVPVNNPLTSGTGSQRIVDGDVAVVDANRKSTRLNSSHGYISYAAFCLNKKKAHIYS